MDKPVTKRSPLKAPPLRNPGQSLSEAFYDLVYGKVLLWAMFGIILLVMAATEWVRWLLKSPPQPVFVTTIGILGCAFAAWRVKQQWPKLCQLGLGLRGEKVVGQCLERLRACGYQVFHDIPGDGHNIDHAIVGAGGVFAIETKTIRKPAKGLSEIVFDGKNVTIDGMTPDRDPVVQVSAAAGELGRIIKETTGRELPVRPVLIYPGWYTTHKVKGPRVWVLNENVFPKFLDHEPVKLSADDVHAVAAGLTLYLRNKEQ